MKRVFKYQVPLQDKFTIDLPKGSQVLSVGVQSKTAFIWTLIDDEEPIIESRKFRLSGTGHPITDKCFIFIGTFQLDGGALIFHLFELV